VNSVGVDLNTASPHLLSHVAGIGPALAQNIVETRKKALFGDRSELLKVPRFTPKVYEQSAGFLRILSGKTFLDSTGIHPERYTALRDMAHEIGVPITELVGEGAKKLTPLRPKWAGLIGEFTFDDIIKELEKPGRDPRDPFKAFSFRDDIFEVKDLVDGMICPGIVTNVTNFGAFVDIGVHQDGLVHISELSHKFVNDPRSVVNPGDQVTIRVLTVDKAKNQISLSMKLEAAPSVRREAPQMGQSQDRRPQQGRGGPRESQNAHSGGARGPGGGGSGPGGGNHRDQRNKPAGQPGGQQGRPQGKPQASPFNNPFAALLGNPKK
jgi:uncharacterized protein